MTEAVRPGNVLFYDISRFRAQLFDRLIGAHGLTTSQAMVLAHLYKEDKLRQTEISHRMDVGNVTIGGLVDRLEARGLVERQDDENDRRAKRVCLLEPSRAMGRIMKKYEAEVNKATYAGLSDTEVETLMATLNKVRKNLSGALQPAD